jgi:hypothetical protein
MWRVTVHVSWKTADGWDTSDGVPTFYLNEDELGIVSADHAERIAVKIVNPKGEENMQVHATAARVEYTDVCEVCQRYAEETE